MNEGLLQYIWQLQYFNGAHLTTTGGENVQVIHPGKINRDQGPDFTNAKVRIGSTVLAGTVELHLKTSDWHRHGHEADGKYRNVVLHVVFNHDQQVNEIPVLELQPHISTFLLDRYSGLMTASSFIPCHHSVSQVRDIVWFAWKERLLVERLTRKSAHILQLVEQGKGNWEETFWWMLARNFGAKVNADAFEALARSLPLTILSKHKTQIHQLEGLLFGQANLLSFRFADEYPKLLKREYLFLQKKYGLQRIHLPVLFLRMRPGNFPTVRLAQLAALLHTSVHLFSKMIEADKMEAAQKLFSVTANDYWHYHYRFDQASSFLVKTVGTDTVNNILVNTVIPMLFAYGLYHDDAKYRDKALQWLSDMGSEKNAITGGFAELGIKCKSAYDSQALIELKNEYCNYKRCLECAVGNALLGEKRVASSK